MVKLKKNNFDHDLFRFELIILVGIDCSCSDHKWYKKDIKIVSLGQVYSHLPKVHVQTQISTHISSHLSAYHRKYTLNEVAIW